MVDKKGPDAGIFSQTFQNRLHFIILLAELISPGIRLVSGHVVMGVISGNDHKGRKNYFFWRIGTDFPYQIMNGGFRLNSAQKNIGMSLFLKHSVDPGVYGIYLVGGAVSHKNKSSIVKMLFKFLCNSADHCMRILLAGNQRRSESDRMKAVLKRKRLLFHDIIFDTVQNVGGLNDHVCDPVRFHLFHSLNYVGNIKIVALFQDRQDHLTCPGAVNTVIRKSLGNFFFNFFDSCFSGRLIACSETDGKNCFLCCLVHWKILRYSIPVYYTINFIFRE